MLIHGFGGDLQQLAVQPAGAGRPTAPVYALDLPGHGGSSTSVAGAATWPALAAAVLEALRGARHRARASRRPFAGRRDRAAAGAATIRSGSASVTLVAPAGLGPEIDGDYIEGFIARRPAQGHEGGGGDAVRRSGAGQPRHGRGCAALQAARRRAARRCAAIADAAFPGGRQAPVLRDRLAALGVPVQAIWGAEDRIIPAPTRSAVPEARRHVLAGAGHMVHIERAGEVNRLVRGFIAAAA